MNPGYDVQNNDYPQNRYDVPNNTYYQSDLNNDQQFYMQNQTYDQDLDNQQQPLGVNQQNLAYNTQVYYNNNYPNLANQKIPENCNNTLSSQTNPSNFFNLNFSRLQ